MFKNRIKQIAIQIAVLLFFIMALIGWICDLPIATCSTRAAIGAIATYFIISVASQLIIRVLINAMVDDQVNQHNQSVQR